MIVGAGPFDLIYKNLTIKGTLTSFQADIAGDLNLAKMGKIKGINSRVYPIAEIGEAVKKL